MFMHSARLPLLRASLGELGKIRRIYTHFCFCGDETFFSQDIRATDSTEPLGCLGDLGW